MKKINHLIITTLATLMIFTGVSCKKDPGRLPDISFITGTGYLSSDGTIARNTSFKIGINAAKTENEDVLKTFNISVSYDGGPSETLLTQTLTGAQEDSYSYDLVKNARNLAGTEKYSFTITNRDGLINTISITITVL